MNVKKARYAILLLLTFFFINESLAQLSVNDNETALTLATLLSGPGVVITNPQLTCPIPANGSFTTTSSTNLGIDKGIILTTGRAKTQFQIFGANGSATYLASSNNGAAGDPQLGTLAGNKPTFDACELEFDMVAAGEYVSFQYVFGSEEYINSTCGPYNDAFAFFISGPGISTPQNMALVPGTNIPVTINSINSGIPGSQGNIINCTSMGTGSPFTNYFINNTGGAFITYNGFTTVLTAGHTVTPCSTYHLKIAIADAGNETYDSGVFIKAGSLKATNLSVSPVLLNLNKPFIVKGCQQGQFKIRSSAVKSVPQHVHFTISGTAIAGYDYAAIADSVIIPANDSIALVNIQGLPTPKNGSKTMTIKLQALNSCNTSYLPVDSATITIIDTLHSGILTKDTSVCTGASVLLNAVEDSLFTYLWSPDTTIVHPGIANPVITPSATQTYSVLISAPGTGCADKSYSVKVEVDQKPVSSFTAPARVCLHDSIKLESSVQPPYPGYIYKWSGPDGFSSSAKSPVIAHVGENASGSYTLLVKTDTSDCSVSTSQNITVFSPDKPSVTSPIILCLNSTEKINVKTYGQTLNWYSQQTGGIPSDTPPPINTENIASYQYYITNMVDGCESTRKPIEVAVLKCCDGNIYIPDAFTPNGDGKNDVFRPLPDYGYRLDYFRVYNRWGQPIFYSGYLNVVWDGSCFGSGPAEAGTYYYEMQFSCINGGKEFKKGTVTLLR